MNIYDICSGHTHFAGEGSNGQKYTRCGIKQVVPCRIIEYIRHKVVKQGTPKVYFQPISAVALPFHKDDL